MGRPTCLLLDLDGTLIDSAESVTASVVVALRAAGAIVPDAATLRTFVGPPMLESFRNVLGLRDEVATDAVTRYRSHYSEHGLLAGKPFAGVRRMLVRLHAAGVPMGVATSKAEDQAQQILHACGLDGFLMTVCGLDEESGRSSKRLVIREALRRLRRGGVDVSAPLMVGDRHYDVQSAADEGVPTVYAEWGYGTFEEAQGAVVSISNPCKLLELLLAVRTDVQKL